MAGHVVIEDYVHTAGASVVHQYCHLGLFCFIGGGSVISQDAPRFVMVAGGRAELRGLNFEGLRRQGYSPLEAGNGLFLTRGQRPPPKRYVMYFVFGPIVICLGLRPIILIRVSESIYKLLKRLIIVINSFSLHNKNSVSLPLDVANALLMNHVKFVSFFVFIVLVTTFFNIIRLLCYL